MPPNPAASSDNAEVRKRWGWDSNPRYPDGYTGFQVRRVQPLCHPTEGAAGIVPPSRAQSNVRYTSPEMDPFRSLTVQEFLRRLGDKTPAPGGGAAACAVAATSAALARMVVEYSLGKKNLVEQQPALERAQAALQRLAAMFLELADEDAAAYALLNELERLPEADPRRRAERPGAIEAAIAVPRAAMAGACDLLRLIESLTPITNRHLRSDLAIAAILAEAGAASAWLNVRINLPLLGQSPRAAAITGECVRELADAAARRRSVEAACE